jgi:nucleoside 2-deoxyribosyltransferase
MAQVIYIAGPMSGKPMLNFDAFDHAKDFLKEGGWDVISPADLNRFVHGWGEFPTEKQVAASQTKALTKEQRWQIILTDFSLLYQCDAIFMLHGWENSPGATAELGLAQFLGLEINFAEDSYRSDDIKMQVAGRAAHNTKFNKDRGRDQVCDGYCAFEECVCPEGEEPEAGE